MTPEILWIGLIGGCVLSFTAGLFVEAWDARQPHRTEGRCTVCGRWGQRRG